MIINHTLNYLLAKRHELLLGFSGQVTTLATYLKSAGGEAGDGLPLPKSARIYRIDLWDGSTLHSATGNVSASQGDRLSVYVTPSGGTLNVTVRVNGVGTDLQATGVSQNATLYVSVHLVLIG